MCLPPDSPITDKALDLDQESGMDPSKKQHIKQLVRQSIGEPHVGKRFKMHHLNSVMPRLNASPRAILDAGAEDATFVYWLANRYPAATVLAVDIDQEAISNCLVNRPPKYRNRCRIPGRLLR